MRGVTVGCVWLVSRRRTARTVKLAAECNCAPKPGPRSPPARTRATSQQPRAGLSDLHLDQDLEHVAQPSPAQPSPAQHSGTETTCYIFVAILNLLPLFSLLMPSQIHTALSTINALLDDSCHKFHVY